LVDILEMTVLFVFSGNSTTFAISPFIQAQAESLRKLGHTIDYYPVKGKGLWGYLSNITKLSKFIKQSDYDIVHSHYSFCGIVSALATGKPVVCSLMGSDVKKSGLWRFVIKYFIMYKWKKTIVKSKDMKLALGIDKVEVIPNGVDLDIFRPMNKNDCRKELGWDIGKKIILFASDPQRPEKNFSLAKKATETLNIQDVKLKVVYPVPHKDIPLYLNAADLLLSTSLWEGSPNIIKEAMACNCPIVSTNVGDVKWLLDGLEGCFITTNDPRDVADKIKKALNFRGKTKGREKLISLGLASEHIAKKIIQVYEEVIYNTSKEKVYGR
jgi:teichuronic acid biosynthesis glycosyltransferase TuaC